jgi:hypothetical protein
MQRRRTVSLLAAGLSLCTLACSAGDVGGEESPGGDVPSLPGTVSPPNANRQCAAKLSLTGNYERGNVEEPADQQGGCYPFGTWTLNVQVMDKGACAEVPIKPQYVYQITADEEFSPVVSYTGESTGASDLSVKQAGGECQATFEHFTDGGKGVVRLKAFVVSNETTTNPQISGDGDYELSMNQQL